MSLIFVSHMFFLGVFIRSKIICAILALKNNQRKDTNISKNISMFDTQINNGYSRHLLAVTLIENTLKYTVKTAASYHVWKPAEV